MSRSKRKTPKISITVCGGKAGVMKNFRQKENRRLRRMAKVKLILNQPERIPHDREYGNEWHSPRDGFQWIDKYSKWMRK